MIIFLKSWALPILLAAAFFTGMVYRLEPANSAELWQGGDVVEAQYLCKTPVVPHRIATFYEEGDFEAGNRLLLSSLRVGACKPGRFSGIISEQLDPLYTIDHPEDGIIPAQVFKIVGYGNARGYALFDLRKPEIGDQA